MTTQFFNRLMGNDVVNRTEESLPAALRGERRVLPGQIGRIGDYTMSPESASMKYSQRRGQCPHRVK